MIWPWWRVYQEQKLVREWWISKLIWRGASVRIQVVQKFWTLWAGTTVSMPWAFARLIEDWESIKFFAIKRTLLWMMYEGQWKLNLLAQRSNSDTELCTRKSDSCMSSTYHKVLSWTQNDWKNKILMEKKRTKDHFVSAEI